MTLPTAALQWQAAGFSVIPILVDGTKRPAVRWAPFTQQPADAGLVASWWNLNHDHGIALIMGAVSGGAEMLELEGRACTVENLSAIERACVEAGVVDIWYALTTDGYSEKSPSGGLHLIYRITDHEVPGNEKVARRPASDQELELAPQDRIKVLAETRGERGYVIVAPTSGLSHSSGRPWETLTGTPHSVLGLTWEDRCKIHGAVRLALDESQSAVSTQDGAYPARTHGEVDHSDRSGRPGDDFESVSWDDGLLLGGAGWTRSHQSGSTVHWTRPGKDPRDGFSATTGRDPARDRLYVFSTSTIFPVEEPLTKFHVYALLHHGGDHATAARELRRLGFGSSHSSEVAPLRDFTTQAPIDPESCSAFTLDAVGATERLAAYVKGRFLWVHEEKMYYEWSGRRWRPDHTGSLSRDWDGLTKGLLECEEEAIRKWAGTKARTAQLATWVVGNMRTVSGVTVSRSAFDHDRGLLNLKNGTLDLRDLQFRDHDRDDMMTRIFNCCYDPATDCQQWTKFMEEVLPDKEIRDYVQRACGYSLLGDADQRVMFLVWGPSGTGKTQFLETLRHLFGEYGIAASMGAFAQGVSNKGPSPDIHRFRGKRFVSTSETADTAKFDEEMVKRLTGRDMMTTRSLYQVEQEWTPECTIWIATNHKPRFTSDDDGIWRRSKLLPFTTRFGVDRPEIPDMARRFLFPEADGILNWMLEGLVDYQRNGLREPEMVKQEVAEHRREVDTVCTFLDESIEDGRISMGAGNLIPTIQLYQVYLEWCQRSYERGLSRRRFTQRVVRYSDGLEVLHSRAGSVIKGLAYTGFRTPGDWRQAALEN